MVLSLYFVKYSIVDVFVDVYKRYFMVDCLEMDNFYKISINKRVDDAFSGYVSWDLDF